MSNFTLPQSVATMIELSFLCRNAGDQMHTSEKVVLVPFQSGTANSIEAVLSPHSIEIVDYGMDRSIFGSDFSQST